MINPGGESSVTHSKSAVTRMNNNLVNAAKLSMPFNAAAQASLRHQTSGAKPSGPPVGPSQPPAQSSGLEPQVTEQVALPTGGPVGPPQPDFDPEIFKENLLDQIVGEVRTQHFLNSARVKDAATTEVLRERFNLHNPDKMPEGRNLIQRVLNRIGH